MIADSTATRGGEYCPGEGSTPGFAWWFVGDLVAFLAAFPAYRGGNAAKKARSRWSRGSAIGAGAEDVEPMVVDDEAVAFGDRRQLALEGPFEPGGHREVDHCAAGGAHEVMVMPGEVLGQLEPSVIIGGDHPMDYPGFLQLRQVSVDRALCQRATLGEDLGQGERHACRNQDVDERTPRLGIALPPQLEPFGHLVVDMVVHCGHGTGLD